MRVVTTCAGVSWGVGWCASVAEDGVGGGPGGVGVADAFGDDLDGGAGSDTGNPRCSKLRNRCRTEGRAGPARHHRHRRPRADRRSRQHRRRRSAAVSTTYILVSWTDHQHRHRGRPPTDHPRKRHRPLPTSRDPTRRTRPAPRRRLRHHHPLPNRPSRPHPTTDPRARPPVEHRPAHGQPDGDSPCRRSRLAQGSRPTAAMGDTPGAVLRAAVLMG